jgi:two-component system chemotaxis response regulator CheB
MFRQIDEELVEQLKSLDVGLLDFLSSPVRGGKMDFNEVSLTTRIHILSKLQVEKFVRQIDQSMNRENSLELASLDPKPIQKKVTQISSSSSREVIQYSGISRSAKIIIIGTSTGGPRLLSDIIPDFPINLPPVIVIQHMPVGFISAFASRLNRLSRIKVKEAVDGEIIIPGTVYLAPGGKHLEFFRQANHTICIQLTDGPPVNFVKPAVDITLKSSARIYGSGTIGVILTGMGHDGRSGSKVVKDRGGKIICLNEDDSDVYGMNKAVIEAGHADGIVSKRELVPYIIRAIEGRYLG